MTHNKAIVFPGQGSQFLGMLGDIAAAYPDVLGYFKQASSVLGYDLWDMVQAGPAELLDQTCHTQPALLTASYAIWQVLQAQGHQQPAYLAGHSLGEFSALVCAESLTFLDGVKLVALRGKLMQEAVATCDSALAAILGLDDQKITEICEAAKQAGEVLSPANFNCPGQVVIGGTRVAVERACVLAKTAGAKLTKILPVSVASHCELMRPAALEFEKVLYNLPFETPKIPVISNVDVSLYTTPDSIRDGLSRQLVNPVQWVKTIAYLASKGVDTIIECGPNKILSGLNKRILNTAELFHTADITHLTTLIHSKK